MAKLSWKMEKAAQDAALKKGEEIARTHGFESTPIDPFAIIRSERNLIHVEGDDFGDAFDGRLSYVGPRFLLCFNTKYDVWHHRGTHHPKVRFTVGHELGHFFIDAHRRYLVTHRKPHGSFGEFESNSPIERQADCFSAGLLMPRYLLGPRVNCEPAATVAAIKEAATAFDVSLTGMMVRWTQVSHFPCATLCMRDGLIQWGFVSEAFRNAGFWRARRNQRPTSGHARSFLFAHSDFDSYREGCGRGFSADWLDSDDNRVAVDEFYVVIPYNRCVMVFLTADEDELLQRWGDDRS